MIILKIKIIGYLSKHVIKPWTEDAQTTGNKKQSKQENQKATFFFSCFRISSRFACVQTKSYKYALAQADTPGQTDRQILLHDLVLRDARRRLEAAFHRVPAGARSHVLDERDAQWTTAVLVAGEFGCFFLLVYIACIMHTGGESVCIC